MNYKTLFIFTLIALIGAVIYILTQRGPDCKGALPVDSSLEISPHVAQSRMHSYDTLQAYTKIDTLQHPFNPNDTLDLPVLCEKLEVIRGFKIMHDELSTIIGKLGPGHAVYAMLGVADSTHGNGSSQFIDLIFQVSKKPEIGEVTHSEDDDNYYDFSHPCPDSCP